VRLYPAASDASEAVGQIVTAVMEPGRRTAQHLGIEVTPRTGAYRTRHGRWVIETDDESARDYWTSEPRAALLQEWHYDGELVAAGECVAWRLPGLLKASQLDELLRRTLEARTLLHRTSTAQEG
jgi:hypothetical protein